MNRFWLFVCLCWVSISCRPELPSDLTLDIVGTYRGTLTLNLGTDSSRDVSGVELAITRLDDEQVEISPLTYPAASPLAGQPLAARLSRTPNGLIQTEGVMLTLDLLTLPDGTVQGVPYAGPVASAPDQHGRYARATGELLYTVQIWRDGVDTYELFEGQRE